MDWNSETFVVNNGQGYDYDRWRQDSERFKYVESEEPPSDVSFDISKMMPSQVQLETAKTPRVKMGTKRVTDAPRVTFSPQLAVHLPIEVETDGGSQEENKRWTCMRNVIAKLRAFFAEFKH